MIPPLDEVRWLAEKRLAEALRFHGASSAQARAAAVHLCKVAGFDPFERTALLRERVSVTPITPENTPQLKPNRYRHRWEDVIRSAIYQMQ